MSDDSTFVERNKLRKRQIEFAKTDWVREIGDRVQFKYRYGDIEAWSEGVIIDLFKGTRRYGNQSFPTILTAVQVEGHPNFIRDGDVNDQSLPIVPHEDYFKGEGKGPQHE